MAMVYNECFGLVVDATANAEHTYYLQFARAREARMAAAQRPAAGSSGAPQQSAAAGLPDSGAAGTGEAAAIDAENRAALAAMTSEQVRSERSRCLRLSWPAYCEVTAVLSSQGRKRLK